MPYVGKGSVSFRLSIGVVMIGNIGYGPKKEVKKPSKPVKPVVKEDLPKKWEDKK